VKELWIELNESVPYNLKDGLLKSAAQVCDAIIVGARDIENARKIGAKIAASSGGCDIDVLEAFDEKRVAELKKRGRVVAVKVIMRERKDEEMVIKAMELSSDYVILNCPNWKVIPLENIVAKTYGKCKLLAEVSCAKDAKLALETLELGADGVVLKAHGVDEIIETAAIVKKQALKVVLASAKIVDLKQIGTGARVCVDTCDLMKPGEGILVGCQSSGLFLIQAEVHENPYVEARPFRVNAGSVPLYVLSSPNKTRYLSELKAGDEILIVDREGKIRPSSIGRVKIEWRPVMLIEAEYEGKRLKTIVQNAETVRLVTEDGSKSIAELKTGDEVLVCVTEGGRHFGTLVKEERVIER